jgi:hypothetical protein
MQRPKENNTGNDYHGKVLKLSQKRLRYPWQQRLHEPRYSTTANLLSQCQSTETSLQQPSHLFQPPRKVDRENTHSKEKIRVQENDHNRLSVLPSVSSDELSKRCLPSDSTTESMALQRKSKYLAQDEAASNQLGAATDRFLEDSKSCAVRSPRIDFNSTNKADLAMTARSVTSNHESAKNRQIPISHILSLQAAYGNKVDLYCDVLKIKPNATERQIRIAYFRQGRLILTDDDELLPESKQHFEAISLAYEILSRWREQYDSCDCDLNQLLSGSRLEFGEKQPAPQNQTPIQTASSEKTGTGMPSLTNKSRGIHWNEKVEEWLYEQNPQKADNVFFGEQATIMGTDEQLQHQHHVLGKSEINREMSNDNEELFQPETKHSECATKTVVNARSLAKHLTNFDPQTVNAFLESNACEESFGAFVECSSKNDFHLNDSRTPKKSNRTKKCYEDFIVDLYQSLEKSLSPNDVLPRSPPKYHANDTLARNLFQEDISHPMPKTSKSNSRVEQNECCVDEWSEFQLSLDENSLRSAFSRDPFADLYIPSLGTFRRLQRCQWEPSG